MLKVVYLLGVGELLHNCIWNLIILYLQKNYLCICVQTDLQG